jgi:hypothetical protein
MYPPIFEKCASDSTVQNNIGASPVRLYPFGEAPGRAQLPYAVWQLTGGSPENYLATTPDADKFNIQVDVYAATASAARAAAQALRNVIQQFAYIVAWRVEGKDPETNNYRYAFDVEWIVNR